ncbi:hypothetical protein ACIRSU_13970 [Streptomyces sp. NPDC101160]|uniref:hypothetical protein n=1 Tax=Streptomyces sp. NPDC101160 TaxID=3366118 RepID=UPI0037F44C64
MIELIFLAAFAALVGWLVNRKQRRRSDAFAAGEVVAVPGLLKGPGQGARWRAGRLVIGAEPPVWRPSRGGPELALPADLRPAGTRPPTLREAIRFNPRARVVACESAAGPVLIAVLPEELERVLGALERG